MNHSSAIPKACFILKIQSARKTKTKFPGVRIFRIFGKIGTILYNSINCMFSFTIQVISIHKYIWVKTVKVQEIKHSMMGRVEGQSAPPAGPP